MTNGQNLIQYIKDELENWKVRVRQAKADKKRIALMKESEHRIQVKEFDNMLCLSIDGIPLLPMREFNKQTLADARLTLFNYLKTK